MTARRDLSGLARLALLLAVLGAALAADRVEAQAPPATEEQALAIERQLMCPQCPNERLDTCERPVCRDMKRIIREQLADGRTPDDIVLFFEVRYGPRVRADLPAEGFNLILYGWIAAALLAVVAGGGWYLRSLRCRTVAADASTGSVDDAWLDEQLADANARDVESRDEERG